MTNTNNLVCPECASVNLRKEGSTTRWRNRQRVRVQRYRCLDCGLLTTKPDNLSQEHLLKCLRCGHTWPSTNTHPRQCPNCHSSYWDKPKKETALPSGV